MILKLFYYPGVKKEGELCAFYPLLVFKYRDYVTQMVSYWFGYLCAV